GRALLSLVERVETWAGRARLSLVELVETRGRSSAALVGRACRDPRPVERGSRWSSVSRPAAGREIFAACPGSRPILGRPWHRTLLHDRSTTRRSTTMSTTSPDLVTAQSHDTQRELSTLARVAGAFGLAQVVVMLAAITQEVMVEHSTPLATVQHDFATAD